MSMVMHYEPMPPRMRRHATCLLATMELEIELFGRVLSESIKEPLERYSWWPLTEKPPSISVEPRPTPNASKVPSSS